MTDLQETYLRLTELGDEQGAREFIRQRRDEPFNLDCSLLGLMEVINQTAHQGEPIFMADWARILHQGQQVRFEDGTRGVLSREVSRDEYMAWKERLFPGLPQEHQDCRFYEVRVD